MALSPLIQRCAAPSRQNAGEFFPAFCFSPDMFRLPKTGIPIQRNSFYAISFPVQNFGEEGDWWRKEGKPFFRRVSSFLHH